MAASESRAAGSAVLALARQALEPGMGAILARRLGTRLWSRSEAIGLRRDLDRPFTAPEARIPLEIRELRAAEAPAILGDGDPTLDAGERWERTSRLRLWQSGLGRCFAAIAADGRPCFVQWAFLAADNARMSTYFGGSFPELAPGEALIEGAYTPTALRGMGIMASAMARIAPEVGRHGARHLHTFVDVRNMPSLKGCLRAGYVPWQWRDQSWRLGRRRNRFGPLPADLATRFPAMHR